MNELLTNSSPKVSVIMSCYNSSRWLNDAIESVLCQSFKDFEFIVIDDGSEDDTWKIIQSYKKQDNRIVSISKTNTGLTDSLNLGLLNARGKWIARLDADDLCEPMRLEKQVEYLRCHPDVVLLGSGFIEINEQGREIKEHKYPVNYNKLTNHLERLRRFFPHSSALFNRDIVKDAGNYNLLFKKSQDHDLWLRIAEHRKIACLEGCYVKIRRHSNQISNSNTGVPQLVYGVAAATCHFLRVNGHNDPSNGENQLMWHELTDWIQQRMKEEAVFEKYNKWSDARIAYYSVGNKFIAPMKFLNSLIFSGCFGLIVMEKLFGSSLPQKLAREWSAQSCVE